MSGINRLRRIALTLCRDQAVSRVIDPLLADMTFDCTAGRGPARYLKCCRWLIAFSATVVTLAVVSARADARAWLTRDSGAAGRTLMVGSLVAALLGVFFAGAQLWIFTIHLPMPLYFDATGWTQAALYLLPQGVGGFPLAILMSGMTRRRDSRSARQALMLLTLALTVAATVCVEWGIPLANQAFREHIFGGRLPPGAYELGITGVIRALMQNGPLPRPLTVPSLWMAFHLSLAIVLAPLAFALLTRSLSTLSLRHARWLAASISAAWVFYFVGPDFPVMAEAGVITPAVVAWAPLTVAFAVSAIISQRSASPPGVTHVSI